jgi:3-oxoacyl-[acyl-carrier-protein] synthase II
MNPDQRIVVTGMGAVTPLGESVAETWDAVVDGQTGFRNIREDILADYPQLRVHVAATVPDFSLLRDEYFGARLTEKDLRSLHRSAQFGMLAASQALRQAGLLHPDERHEIDPGVVDPDRVGVRMGTGIGGADELGPTRVKINQGGKSDRVMPTTILRVLPERVATSVSMYFQARGPVNTVIGACATGNLNIGDAARLLKLSEADVMIAGGTEAQISPEGIALFDGTTALDGTDDLSIASSPFNKRAKGFVMGEGAGALILETLAHAKRRGALVLAELVGYGETSDAYHVTRPSGVGAVRALQIAQRTVPYNGLGYINAHATGTGGDAIELTAISEVFSPDEIAGISSTKANIGHLLGAAGAIESIFSIEALRKQMLPPTLKASQDPIPETAAWQMNFDAAARTPVDYAVNNSFGFGGLNAVTHWRMFEE